MDGKKENAKLVDKISLLVKSGDPDNREAYAAKIYWKALFGKDFLRDKNEEGINSLLNYGYAVMRAAMARAICAAGLFPSLGIHHDNNLNQFCLVDDLFEIYRPLVDFTVTQLQKEGKEILTPETKMRLADVLWIKLHTTEGNSPAFQSMQYMAKAYVHALENKKPDIELPLWDEDENARFDFE